MRLPKLLYELYPLLYVLGGIAAIIELQSVLPTLCGIILTCCGVAILFMRRNYRTLKQQIAQLS